MRFRYQPTELFLLTLGLIALVAVLGLFAFTTMNAAHGAYTDRLASQALTPSPRSQHGPDVSHCLEDSNTQPLWDCIRYVKEDESEHQ